MKIAILIYDGFTALDAINGRGRRSAHTLLASKGTRNFEVDYLCLHGITDTRRGRHFKRAAGNNALVCPRFSAEVRSSVPE